MSFKHLKYTCDMPCWFIDQYNELLDIVKELQEGIRHE